MAKKIIIEKNPIFDWCILQMGGQNTVPTKQEKFKPLKEVEGSLKTKDNIEVSLKELYVKKPSEDVVKRFEEKFKKIFAETVDGDYPIKSPTKVEVVLHIQIEKKRYLDVDVDNLSKTILDCLKGIIIEDDHQVASLLVQKAIHPYNLPGLAIGLRIIEGIHESLFHNVKLYTYKEID